MRVNYGVLKKEHHDENLRDLTVKGAKKTLVSSLETTLAQKTARLQELKKEQDALKQMGKDLDAEDLARVRNLERIVADLKKTIKEQTEMFGLRPYTR